MHTFVRRKDGLEVIFVSDRTGGLGWWELWTSTRTSTSSPWSTPVHLSALVNSEYDETRPSLSWDGTTLYFWTDRESWMIHLYKSERAKITGKK
jgi:Tol biopolymer transport system component